MERVTQQQQLRFNDFMRSCSSFIADETGVKVEEMDRVSEGFIVHTFDLDKINKKRISWGVFRDRRPDMYAAISHQSFVVKNR